MTLRILAGSLKGRPLSTPKSEATRPTRGLLRKSLFDMCRGEIEDEAVLDLYAGSGAVGIEAISRGASSAVLVDSGREALRAMRKNVETLKLDGQIEIIGVDVLRALRLLGREGRRFALIYIDPPYGKTDREVERLPELLEAIAELGLIQKGGRVFVEEAINSGLMERLGEKSPLRYIETRRFGRTLLHQFTT